MKIIHLTDTHFVPSGERLYGGNPRETLDAAIADINANHADADLVVITGDLTHWGEAAAFENLSEAISALQVPVKLLIGNHDDRELFSEHFPGQERDGDGFVQSVMDTAMGRFVFLDTVLAGTHAGHYCERRQAWLAEVLRETAERDIFLFMHHPPFLTGIPGPDSIGLKDDAAFRAVVSPYKDRIRHLFFGHVHRPIAGSWLGIPVTTLRAINHQVWFNLTESDLTGSFEPPAYCVVFIDAERVIVHFHDFLDSSTKFKLSNSPWDDWSRRYDHP